MFDLTDYALLVCMSRVLRSCVDSTDTTKAQGASLENAKRPKQKGFNDKPRSVPVTSPANAEGGNKDSIKNHRLSESPSIQGGEIVRAERGT